VQESLEVLQAGLRGQARIPLRVLVDAFLHGPDQVVEALLSGHCIVASLIDGLPGLRSGRARSRHGHGPTRARLRTRRACIAVQGHLELLDRRLRRQARVPLGVLEDSDLHGPHQVVEALLPRHRTVATFQNQSPR